MYDKKTDVNNMKCSIEVKTRLGSICFHFTDLNISIFFRESDYQCMLMAMNENSLVDKVRKSQLIRWRAKQNQFNKTTTTSKPMKQKTKLFQKQLNKATIT
jgi:hypothetical protein